MTMATVGGEVDYRGEVGAKTVTIAGDSEFRRKEWRGVLMYVLLAILGIAWTS